MSHLFTGGDGTIQSGLSYLHSCCVGILALPRAVRAAAISPLIICLMRLLHMKALFAAFPSRDERYPFFRINSMTSPTDGAAILGAKLEGAGSTNTGRWPATLS